MKRLLLPLLFFMAPVLLTGGEGLATPSSGKPALAAAKGLKPASVPLAPHKALYDIRLTASKSGSQVLNISGKMFFEWKASCEGWISDHRFNLLYEYADAPAMQIASNFSTFERNNGRGLDFSSRRTRDGELYQELRGRVDLDAKGAGKAVYSHPPALTFDLPPGTLFPSSHTTALLRAIAAGKTFFNAVVFDGSDEEGPVEINAFLGAPVNALAARPMAGPKIDSSLLNTRAWKVHMAFFPLADTKSESDYEMDMIFHENGVISDMKINYEDFSIAQTLVAVERLPAEACDMNVKGTKP